MKRKCTVEELQNLITTYDGMIVYKPLTGEIDYNDVTFPLVMSAAKITLPHTKISDPFVWATKCATEFKDRKCCILIPGVTFDRHGTRHGKGGGWYDRFLSKLPSSWLKVGVAHDSQFSFSPLKRETWDVSVDYILVCAGTTWKVYEV